MQNEKKLELEKLKAEYSLSVCKRIADMDSPENTKKRLEGFQWPVFVHEIDRIKKNTLDLADIPTHEALSKYYNITYKKKQDSDVINEYQDVKVGDIIPLYIKEVNKKGVIFDQGNMKEVVVCNTNLYQYPKFRDFLPTKPVNCQVISHTNNKIVVDPFSYMYNTWIEQHTNFASNCNIKEDKSVLVEDLKLVRGGFIGKIRVDNISDFCGKDVYAEAFIPGSHIVLNIEYNFESWIGKSVKAFITNYAAKPYGPGMIFTCSAKEYLRHKGNLIMIQMFKDWTETNEAWDAISKTTYEGVITGICHTSNKCGAFVELPFNTTAMLPCNPNELSNYKRGDKISVKIDTFEEPTKWNGLQMEHIPPYIIEDNILKRCNVRMILKKD